MYKKPLYSVDVFSQLIYKKLWNGRQEYAWMDFFAVKRQSGGEQKSDTLCAAESMLVQEQNGGPEAANRVTELSLPKHGYLPKKAFLTKKAVDDRITSFWGSGGSNAWEKWGFFRSDGTDWRTAIAPSVSTAAGMCHRLIHRVPGWFTNSLFSQLMETSTDPTRMKSIGTTSRNRSESPTNLTTEKTDLGHGIKIWVFFREFFGDLWICG